ncbi:MAG TPA: pyrimidine dimer DNA glycosylase/endonuclease V [Pyrinomonadaceae bacterium]|jgi:hypothetical protein
MRLWTLHPRYLDTQGLLAAWREGLLAQKVLHGETRGYRHHPQLTRFKTAPDPRGAIAAYLRGLYAEACARGYRFDAEKIAADDFAGRLDCTRGQLLYEWQHLRAKLRQRDARKFAEVQALAAPEAHPLFNIVAGGVEAWEVTNETYRPESSAAKAKMRES